MKNIGKISIILPCYHSELFVAGMIKDIQKQSYTDWELLIISNGKGNEKQETLIHSYSEKDNRIILVRTEQSGVSNARNIGIHKASGKWLTFVDADDRLDNNHLELLANGINENIDIVMGGYYRLDKPNASRTVCELRPGYGITNEVAGRLSYVWCTLLNYNALKQMGGGI